MSKEKKIELTKYSSLQSHLVQRADLKRAKRGLLCMSHLAASKHLGARMPQEAILDSLLAGGATIELATTQLQGRCLLPSISSLCGLS